MVIYQRLLHFWWQQNGTDRLQIDTICNQNEQFMAVIDVCEQLSKGCSVDTRFECSKRERESSIELFLLLLLLSRNEARSMEQSKQDAERKGSKRKSEGKHPEPNLP